jgi:hypothetical protein
MDKLYETLICEDGKELRLYPPVRRTIFILKRTLHTSETKSFFLPFPYLLFGKNQLFCAGMVANKIDLNDLKTPVLTFPFYNADDGVICSPGHEIHISSERKLSDLITGFWNSRFTPGDSYYMQFLGGSLRNWSRMSLEEVLTVPRYSSFTLGDFLARLGDVPYHHW